MPLYVYRIRVVNVHTGYYFYRIHQAQSVIFTTEEKLKRQIDSMALTLDIMRENIGDHPKREEIISSLKAWSALMARAHYSQARGAGFSALYEYIKEKYRVEKLTLATLRDGYYYESKALLGDNFKDIDKALMQIWDAEPPVRVKYSKADRYLKAQVEYLNSLGKITDDRAKMIVEIPKPIIGFKKKLLHNTFLYRIGLILFKKGSCARNFLKKFL